MTEHQGLPVRGYKPQNATNVALVNDGKELEAALIRYINALSQMEDTDKRMLAIAKTNIQTGCMWAWRSVFQPDES